MGDLGTSGKSVEHRHQQLKRATVAQLIAFCCWQATWLWSERFAAGSALTPLVSVGVGVAGLAWPVLMVRLALLQRSVAADPVLSAALNDERTREVRLRAGRVGFFTLVAYLVGLMVVSPWWAPPVRLVSQLGIFLGVAAFNVAFLFLEYGGGKSAE